MFHPNEARVVMKTPKPAQNQFSDRYLIKGTIFNDLFDYFHLQW